MCSVLLRNFLDELGHMGVFASELSLQPCTLGRGFAFKYRLFNIERGMHFAGLLPRRICHCPSH